MSGQDKKINLDDIMMLLGAFKNKIQEHDKVLSGVGQQLGIITWYMEFLTIKISEFMSGLNPDMSTETLKKEFEEFVTVKMKEMEELREQYLKEQATVGNLNLNE